MTTQSETTQAAATRCDSCDPSFSCYIGADACRKKPLRQAATPTAEDMQLAREIVSFRSVASNPNVIAKQIAQLIAAARSADRAEIERLSRLLTSANKWLRRLEERRAELPASFFRDCDPAPLRKKISAALVGESAAKEEKGS